MWFIWAKVSEENQGAFGIGARGRIGDFFSVWFEPFICVSHRFLT